MNGDFFKNDNTQQAGSSRSRHNNNMYVVPTENGVIRSNLTPTAREFTPSGTYVPLDGGDKSRGAIRKQSGNYNKGGGGGGGGGSSTTRQFFNNRHRENKYSSKERQQEQDSQNRNDYNGYGRNNHHYYGGNGSGGGGGSGRRYNRYYDQNGSNGRTYYGKNRNGENKRGGETRNDNNWRRADAKSNEKTSDGPSRITKKNLDAGSQRERLEQMINRRTLECLVCCEKLRNTDKIWSCKQCYHIIHLHCTIKWASSSKLENGWRCPACQNVCVDVPTEYRCYCGKAVNPPPDPHVIAHSCGETCAKEGRTCKHECSLLCHPGPCPDCNVIVTRRCGCGTTTQMVRCGSDVPVICQSICNKLLECTVHFCALKCHQGECLPCTETLKQECFCGKVGRKIGCSLEFKGATKYSCDEPCERTLSCGNHKCTKVCHDGTCEPCALAPERITFCPCGQTKLEKNIRNSCLDPIPCCDKICGKSLKCGQPSQPHSCKEKCHHGDCQPCPLTTLVRCRCGHMDKEIECVALTTKADDARCGKKCTKKRTCGKHRCNQYCCIEFEHICPLPCTRQLSCGLHRCPLTCHSGRCPPCTETSFEELYCECGASVLYPPVACGTRPPPCNKPCSKARDCGHDVNHTCHTGPCPPCTVLCKRWCHGKHELRAAVPCHQENFSCGLACGLELSCGRHKCIQACHAGDCPTVCTQKCMVERAECGHACNAPCHEPPCPETACKEMVKITCQCGLRASSRPCVDLSGEYQSIAMANFAKKMAEMQLGHSVDISDIVSNQKKPTSLKTLECNEECRIVERNRRLAIGLQIRNPDISAKLTPRYSDYMKTWAKKDPKFCQHVHDKLTELVQLAKQSKQKSRSYSFECMNRDKRHFVHEYCEHFGCESAAYDQEPNRNVVATALRDKSWLPSISLLELIQRENGQRKVPGPVLGRNSNSVGQSVSLRLPGRSVGVRPATPPSEYSDRFNPPI